MTLEQKPTVVIAEHSPSVANTVASAFSTAGFEVVGVCADGLTAVQMVRARRPSVLSVDLILPRFGGLQVAESIDSEPKPKLIAITAVTARARVAEARRLGVCYYVLKPLNPTKLRAALNGLFESHMASLLRRVG